MRPPGWKKDPVFRAYVEMKERERFIAVNARKQYDLQMQAVDHAAQVIVMSEARKVPPNAPKH